MARTTSPQGQTMPSGLMRLCLGTFTAIAATLSTVSWAGPPSAAPSDALSTASTEAVAGEVVLSAGPAFLRLPTGETPISRGTKLKPGDTIVTGEGGFVHVKMADGGLVAVRPLSLFEIEVFDYRRQAHSDRVRYRLEEGVARSITGAVGETNKESFRLNTPVAAVGVRGTDFVVATTATASRVAVNSGAVVVAPLSANCSAAGFGACSANGVLLGKADGPHGEYVEVVRGEAAPRLVRDPDNTPDRISPPHKNEPTIVADESTEDVTSAIKTTDITERRLPLQPEEAPVPKAVPELVAMPADVHWGRWTRPDNVEDTSLTRVAHLVRQNLPIQVVNSHYGAGITAMATELPRSGRVDFAAAGGEGVFVSDGQITALSVAGGSLSVNFDNRSFESDARFASADRHFDTQAAGQIDARGYLRSDPSLSNARVTGALSENLDSAITAVERDFDDGLLSGVVAWGVQQ